MVTNRKVVAQEEVTSPAGKWNCYRITFDGLMKTEVAGIGIPIKIKGTEWFAPNFGIVKTETDNKKGKKMGYMLLTSLKK